MKTISVIHGIVLAVILTFIAAPLKVLLLIAFPTYLAQKLTAIIIGGLYIGAFLNTIKTKNGVFVTSLIVLGAYTGTLLVQLSLTETMVTTSVLIWFTRCLLLHRRPATWFLDALISFFAYAAFTWVSLINGNQIFGLWFFFLTQALYALITESKFKQERQSQTHAGNNSNGRFSEAHKAAEQALVQLFN